MAKATDSKINAAPDPAAAEMEAKMQEKVKVKLPLTKELKDDVSVAVNGKVILIKRGEWVEIPRCYKEVLDNAAAQEQHAVEFMEKASNT